MDRDRLLDDLRWLVEGNPRYAGTSEEGQQDPVVAHLMADDLLLSYIDDQEVTELFNGRVFAVNFSGLRPSPGRVAKMTRCPRPHHPL
jgi:hypothetical protein